MKTKISIEGMSCQHCVSRVRNALSGLAGVGKVDVDLKAKAAVIESALALDKALIEAAISDAGYEVCSVEPA